MMFKQRVEVSLSGQKVHTRKLYSGKTKESEKEIVCGVCVREIVTDLKHSFRDSSLHFNNKIRNFFILFHSERFSLEEKENKIVRNWEDRGKIRA